MDFEKMLEHFEKHKAEYYEKLLREEKELLEAITQRNQAIASGEIDFMDYYLWDHKDKDPELLRQWVKNAEQLIAVTEQALGRPVAGSERKAFCEMGRLNPDPTLNELRRIWDEIVQTGNIVSLDAVRQKKVSGGTLAFNLREYYLREYKKEHPSVHTHWVETSDKLIAATEKLVSRELEDKEYIALCELAKIDPESSRDLQTILDEIVAKR